MLKSQPCKAKSVDFVYYFIFIYKCQGVFRTKKTISMCISTSLVLSMPQMRFQHIITNKFKKNKKWLFIFRYIVSAGFKSSINKRKNDDVQ